METKIFHPKDLFVFITKELSWREVFFKYYTHEDRYVRNIMLFVAATCFLGAGLIITFAKDSFLWWAASVALLLYIICVVVFKTWFMIQNIIDEKYFNEVGIIRLENEDRNDAVLRYKLTMIGNKLLEYNTHNIYAIYDEIIHNLEYTASKSKFRQLNTLTSTIVTGVILPVISKVVDKTNGWNDDFTLWLHVSSIVLVLLGWFFMLRYGFLGWYNTKSKQYQEAANLMRKFKLHAKQLGFIKE
jgi:ABC-type siderophore export system fused ATPase/permease subunit